MEGLVEVADRQQDHLNAGRGGQQDMNLPSGGGTRRHLGALARKMVMQLLEGGVVVAVVGGGRSASAWEVLMLVPVTR